MRVLVTGATGMLGRSLLPRLAGSHEVYAVARSPAPELGGANVAWIRQDLTLPLGLEALPSRLDVIVHLAQSQRYRDFPDGAEDIFEVNVHSTFRLLEYARRAGAEAFVLASTGGVYAPSAAPIDEDAPLQLAGPYFRSKRIAELLLDDYAGLLAPVVLRFFFVYGPGGGRTLVPRLGQRILAGEEISIEGDPGMRMNPLFADDAAAAVDAALALRQPSLVNVAGAEVVSVTELVRRLGAALGREPAIRHVERGGGAGDMVADTRRMRALLGGAGRTALEPGLRAAARSLRGSDSAQAAASTL